MRIRFLANLTTVSLLSLALACGDDTGDNPNEPDSAQTNLGDLGGSTKADEFEPVELNVDANSEREFDFESDSLGLVFTFSQHDTSNPQPNRIVLEEPRSDGLDGTLIETETSTDHEFIFYRQSRVQDDYKLVITNEGDQPLTLVMTIQPHEYDPCERILRGEHETVLITPLARCSSIDYADEDGIYVLKDVDLCIATGYFTEDYHRMLPNHNIRDFIEIQGYTDFEKSETGETWNSRIGRRIGVPFDYDTDVTTETEDEITIWKGFGGYIDGGQDASREQEITFDKNALTFDLERKVKRNRITSLFWRSEWAYTLSCEAYETLDSDVANASE